MNEALLKSALDSLDASEKALVELNTGSTPDEAVVIAKSRQGIAAIKGQLTNPAAAQQLRGVPARMVRPGPPPPGPNAVGNPG